MVILISLLAVFFFAIAGYTQLDKFGAAPKGQRLKSIRQSPNIKKDKFQNQSFTPTLAEGHTYSEAIWEFIFKRNPDRIPTNIIPSTKTDLLNLNADENVLVWFGHSSYFIQLDGRKFLVDPVFSGNASPVPRSNKPFNGSDVYKAHDIPEIDYLIITHDHYDHVDYDTLVHLKSKVKKVITGLGVGAHLEKWGYSADIISEYDWYKSAELENGFTIETLPARHFSGRSFIRNNTLWVSFLLKTPSMNIYIGGDSGYDKHFKEIGDKFQPIDLAILDNGQYDAKWKYIHMLPEEVIQAAQDLKAKRVFPVHSSKFVMSNHPWNDPLNRVSDAAVKKGVPIITPVIGEKVKLKEEQTFTQWWKSVE